MKRLLAALFCLLLISSVLLIGSATPPLLSPDEDAHLVRAYTLVSSEWTMHNSPGKSSAAWVDPALVGFIRLHARRNWIATGRKASEPLPTEAVLRAADKNAMDSRSKPVSKPAPGAAVYPPLSYLPQGLALGIAQALHLPVGLAYGLARLLTLTFSAVALFIAFLLIIPSPLQLALFTLPMGLFQLASASVDGFSNSIAMLAISLHLASGEATHRHRRSLHVGLLVCLLLTVPARLHLWPLLLLPFMSARRLRERWALVSSLATSCAVGLWVFHVCHNTVDLRRAQAGASSDGLLYTAGQLISHPIELFSLLTRTLSNQEQLAFYGRSFIGVLGWLHLPLEPPIIYPLMTVMISLCALLSLLWAWKQPLQLFQPNRLLLVGLALVSILSIFLLLLVSWTPNPTQASLIEGVQGRYFLIPALLITFAIAPPQERLQRPLDMAVSYASGTTILMLSTFITLKSL